MLHIRHRVASSEHIPAWIAVAITDYLLGRMDAYWAVTDPPIDRIVLRDLVEMHDALEIPTHDRITTGNRRNRHRQGVVGGV